MTPSRAPLFATLGLAAMVAIVVASVIASPTRSPGRPITTTSTADRPSCADGCRAASRCGIGAIRCMADCQASSALRACLAQASTDCNAAAQCTFAAICDGAGPHGSGTCADSLRCQMTHCGAGDLSCACQCAATMDPAKSLFLLRVDACATDCKFDNACMLRSCKLAGEACAMH